MTDQQHPITPPSDLRWLWREQAPRYRDGGVGRDEWLMERSAQWGADQELEACIAWLGKHGHGYLIAADRLRAARRPKPPTLAEEALEQYDRCVSILKEKGYFPAGCIRDALVRLKQLEDSNV